MSAQKDVLTAARKRKISLTECHWLTGSRLTEVKGGFPALMTSKNFGHMPVGAVANSLKENIYKSKV